MRIMYDGIDSDADVIPTSAQLVAGYDDGFYAWKDTDWARFPDSVHVHIVAHQTTNSGAVLDVEEGNASPAQSVDWVLMRRLAGADPTVYCNEENTLPLVQAAFKARNVIEPHYWLANYNGSQTIPVGAVAHQYESDVNWDISSVADYWPGVDPVPAETEEEDMTANLKQSQMSNYGVAVIGFAANTDTTVEFGTDPEFLSAKPTFRVSLMMAGKTPTALAEDVTLDETGTYVLHIPADLVPSARFVAVTCSSSSVPFAVYVQ